MPYKMGDYLMVCDRTGGTYLRSQMRYEEFSGAWVRKESWESEPPQNQIEAIPDDQSVPVARPDTVASQGSTTLAADASKGATSLTLTAVGNLAQYYPIGIALNNSTVHWSFITADPATGVVVLNDLLPYAADSGNTVHLPTVNNY